MNSRAISGVIPGASPTVMSFNDNSLGDTSVIAVAAVAVVAGAALVLTRKKSKDEDAE